MKPKAFHEIKILENRPNSVYHHCKLFPKILIMPSPFSASIPDSFGPLVNPPIQFVLPVLLPDLWRRSSHPFPQQLSHFPSIPFLSHGFLALSKDLGLLSFELWLKRLIPILVQISVCPVRISKNKKKIKIYFLSTFIHLILHLTFRFFCFSKSDCSDEYLSFLELFFYSFIIKIKID